MCTSAQTNDIVGRRLRKQNDVQISAAILRLAALDLARVPRPYSLVGSTTSTSAIFDSAFLSVLAGPTTTMTR